MLCHGPKNVRVGEAMCEVESILVVHRVNGEGERPERPCAGSHDLVLEVARVGSRAVPAHAFFLGPHLRSKKSSGVHQIENVQDLTLLLSTSHTWSVSTIQAWVDCPRNAQRGW